MFCSVCLFGCLLVLALPVGGAKTGKQGGGAGRAESTRGVVAALALERQPGGRRRACLQAVGLSFIIIIEFCVDCSWREPGGRLAEGLLDG